MNGNETRTFFTEKYGKLLDKARKTIWFAMTRGDIGISEATGAREVLDAFEMELDATISAWKPDLDSKIARELDNMWSAALAVIDTFFTVSRVLDRKV